jgi:hypothetical protein
MDGPKRPHNAGRTSSTGRGRRNDSKTVGRRSWNPEKHEIHERRTGGTAKGAKNAKRVQPRKTRNTRKFNNEDAEEVAAQPPFTVHRSQFTCAHSAAAALQSFARLRDLGGSISEDRTFVPFVTFCSNRFGTTKNTKGSEELNREGREGTRSSFNHGIHGKFNNEDAEEVATL